MEIKLKRIRKGLTQKELKDITKVCPTTMIKIERGIFDRVTYSQMKRISEALDCTVTELFFPEELIKEEV